nr:hypothetical protein CFP56_58812 [Quercus suber]
MLVDKLPWFVTIRLDAVDQTSSLSSDNFSCTQSMSGLRVRDPAISGTNARTKNIESSLYSTFIGNRFLGPLWPCSQMKTSNDQRHYNGRWLHRCSICDAPSPCTFEKQANHRSGLQKSCTIRLGTPRSFG